jgi:hypothetical protein
MDSTNIAEFVDADLRNLATEEQLEYLRAHKAEWRTELCLLKRKAEGQMTNYKTRILQLYLQQCKGEIPYIKYLKQLETERTWKSGANRFIQEIETKLAMIKDYDGNSRQAEEL